MRLLRPIPVTDAVLSACSIAEPDASTGEVAWNAATSYAIGDKVVRTTTHRVYVALSAGVSATAPEDDAVKWLDSGPSNRWAAFDNYKSTASKATGTITMTLLPGVCTGLAFYGLVGSTLRVVLKDAVSAEVYSDTVYSLDDYLTGDMMWEFYFGTPRQRDTLRIGDLYPRNYRVELTLSPTGGKAAVGIIAVGDWSDVGLARYGFKAQPVNYSRIKTDDYGNTTIVRGLVARNLNGETEVVSASDAQAAADVIFSVLSVPVAVETHPDPRYDYLSTFGLVSADVAAIGPDMAALTITVRGLI